MTGDKQEQKKAPTITELIDGDEGLKSKRKLLTITSLILLALTFSGAKVEEANTFILKLKFENQNGIAILLVLAIVFLLIRYYNYAKPYHEKLFREWSGRMLKESYFYLPCHHSDTITGLVHDLAPKKVIADQIDPWNWYTFHYEIGFLKRGIRFSWTDQHDSYDEFVSVGWKNYLKVMGYEVKYRIGRYFTHRENLDILAPYFLGVFSILSYFFNAELSSTLSALSVTG
tara:strand:- start:3602 stop:4291 length:690 start_codon:yes stop_codon:yes gene_type:complete